MCVGFNTVMARVPLRCVRTFLFSRTDRTCWRASCRCEVVKTSRWTTQDAARVHTSTHSQSFRLQKAVVVNVWYLTGWKTGLFIATW